MKTSPDACRLGTYETVSETVGTLGIKTSRPRLQRHSVVRRRAGISRALSNSSSILQRHLEVRRLVREPSTQNRSMP